MGFLLQHLLRDSAERRPDATAALFQDRRLSYRELDRLSDSLACALVDAGVVRGDRVALYLDKSTASLVSLHGILKAGGVYVPLDPHAPVQRIAYILNNCGVKCMVASTQKTTGIRSLLEQATALETVVYADSGGADLASHGLRTIPWEAWSVRDDTGAPEVRSVETDLAYILYTSGSTGVPKGVMISHRNALAFVEWAAAQFSLSPEDRLSSHAPLHFDLSIFDVFAAMKAGASVALVPDGTSTFPVRLAEWMRDNEITVWYSVPSILTLLLLKGRLDAVDLRRIRLLIFAGEVFPTKYLRGWMRVLPDATFVNLYGPTETNVITWYQVPPLKEGKDGPIPIGRACANTEIFLVDDEGARVSGPGAHGELYARGATVALGYWGDPRKTAGAFVQNPFEANFADRVYRTGDMVTLAADGCYRLIGRRDRMIKSRGYRIELDEIESVLYTHPEVREAAVIALPDELIGSRMRAFVCGREGVSLDGGALRDYCLARLPRYMVPESFELLEVLPKTSTGKIDRTQLARR